MDRCVDEKSVRASVPREVDETDQAMLVVDTDVAETAIQDLPEVPPRMLGQAASKSSFNSSFLTGGPTR
jgi:hypothetical protein